MRRALKLMAWNDAEILPRGNQRMRYEVTLDECKVIIVISLFHVLYLR